MKLRAVRLTTQAFWAVVFATTTLSPLSAAVFGKDERREIPPSHAGLKKRIGTLSYGGPRVCSAFCISSDTIVTASHCLYGTAGDQKPKLSKFTFKTAAGPDKDVSWLAGAGTPGVANSVISGTKNLSVAPPIEAASDWAVARLETPVCRDGGLPLSDLSHDAIVSAGQRGRVFEIAMHRDYQPTQMVYGGPCGIDRAFPEAGEETIARDFAEPEKIFLHTCDTGAGSSGSPMLVEGKNGPEVVGINVGTYVLSRTQKTSDAAAPEQKSEPIANTAVLADQFRAAVNSMLGQSDTW